MSFANAIRNLITNKDILFDPEIVVLRKNVTLPITEIYITSVIRLDPEMNRLGDVAMIFPSG